MFDASRAWHVKVAPTPKDVVHRDGKGQLYRFRAPAGDGREETVARTHAPVLLVPSMINRWYVLDLVEGASVAAALTNGTPWETYCFDWGEPEDEDRHLGWDDVIARLERVVRRLMRMTGAPRVTLVGYSMGAILSGIVTARAPERIASLVNVVGPFDFAHAGRLGAWTDPRWFDVAAITSAGNVSAWQMHAGFATLMPTRIVGRWLEILDRKGAARDEMLALDRWVNDATAFPAAAYATYVKELYQENRLVRGEHWVRGERVDLSRITCPTLVVAADRDAICPPKAATALLDATRATVKDVITVSGGHVGGVAGMRATKELYPQLRGWLESHTRLSSVSV